MPSGGHARSGPAPDPNSARSERRKDAAGWTTLPAEGFTGRVPTFPLEAPSTGEKKLWRLLWRKPQAVMWARQGLAFQVAAYVRSFLESTEHGAPASLKTAVLRMEDTLGLSTVGLNSLRWKIATDELGEKRTEPKVERPAPARRLRAAGE